MDQVLLVRDLNASRRSLRSALRLLAEDHKDFGPVPHSFDSASLMDVGSRALRRRELSPLLIGSIAGALARVQSIVELFPDAGASLEVWGSRDDDIQSTARRHLLEAELVLIPQFRFEEALTLLHEVIETVGLPRHIRAQAWLLGARCESRLGDTRQAALSFREVLSSAIPSLAPLAENGLAGVWSQIGRNEEAIALSAKAVAGIDRASDPYAWRAALGERASILLRAAHLDGNAEPLRREAIGLINEVLVDSQRVLDTTHSGLAYSTRGAAHVQQGEFEEAVVAYSEAIRYFDPADKTRLSGAYRSLASALEHRGRHDVALAAREAAIEWARGAESSEMELKALSAILRSELHYPDRGGVALARTVARARRITAGGPNLPGTRLISQRTALEFARVLGELGIAGHLSGLAADGSDEPVRVSTDSSRAALGELLENSSNRTWENHLRDKLGEGVPIKAAPEPDRLVPFLLSYSGDTMRINQYLSEFDLKLSQAKTHLKHLCSRGILEIEGVRKAARYYLAFHRADDGSIVGRSSSDRFPTPVA